MSRKESRYNEPLIQAYVKTLRRPKDRNPYSEGTIHSYSWQVHRFLEFCKEAKETPGTIMDEEIRLYFLILARQVRREKKKDAYFYQVCSSIRGFYRDVMKDRERELKIREFAQDAANTAGLRRDAITPMKKKSASLARASA